ncbi:MAG TPA: retropepsin-like aspartic protease [Polyangiales bacterium]|jgi:predicted aspartyl protease
MRRIAFDRNFDPPAPVLPVHVSGVDEHAPGAMMRMLVDTGADCTLIPAKLARTLRLPLVDKIEIQGVGGRARSAAVHAASLRVGSLRTLARVVALGDEALLGRDILNRLVLQIDGPAETISAVARTKRAPK